MSSSSPPSTAAAEEEEKQCLGWMEWLRGWMYLIYEMLFQRITASHLLNPLPFYLLSLISLASSPVAPVESVSKLPGNWQSLEHVIMAVRKPKVAHELIQKWQNDWSGMGLPLDIEVMELDLRFAEAWNARVGPLHVLINNAGIFSIGEPQRFSKDGYEEHMQVNHLAPALLSVLLLPSLVRGSPSRIVNVNSVMHYVGFVDTEDMNVVSERRQYTSLVGYSSSKLAQVMFSSVLHKWLPAEAVINVMCVSPGIVHTNVARDLPRIVQAAYHLTPYFIFTAQEGARSALFTATDLQVPESCDLLKSDEWPVCTFFSRDCRPTNASGAHNVSTANRVWEKTLDMVGLPADAVEKLLEGEEVACRYGLKQD